MVRHRWAGWPGLLIKSLERVAAAPLVPLETQVRTGFVEIRFGRTIGRVLGCDPYETINLMLSWAITFLVIALIAAILGFGGIAGTAVGLAKIIFVVFIILCILTFVAGRRGPPA